MINKIGFKCLIRRFWHCYITGLSLSGHNWLIQDGADVNCIDCDKVNQKAART